MNFASLALISSVSSLTYGSDFLLPLAVFFVFYVLFYLSRRGVFITDVISIILYTALLAAFSDVFGIREGVFLCLSSFVSALFGKKGVLRAASLIFFISLPVLVMCVVTKSAPLAAAGYTRFVFPLVSAAGCAFCTEYGFLKTLVPTFCGFVMGIVYGICGGVFAEIFSYSAAFCAASAVFSGVSVFKKPKSDSYN